MITIQIFEKLKRLEILTLLVYQLYDVLYSKQSQSIIAIWSSSTNFQSFQSCEFRHLIPVRVQSSLLWSIEYHRLLGIQHFFLYDPLLQRKKHYLSLPFLLQNYVKQKLVTVVPWPHDNCVKGMGHGRFVGYRDEATNKYDFFKPPFSVSHVTAFGSCYTRYRYTSKHMLAIDQDEFLLLNSHSTPTNENSKESRLQAWIGAMNKKIPSAFALAISRSLPSALVSTISTVPCPAIAKIGSDELFS